MTYKEGLEDLTVVLKGSNPIKVPRYLDCKKRMPALPNMPVEISKEINWSNKNPSNNKTHGNQENLRCYTKLIPQMNTMVKTINLHDLQKGLMFSFKTTSTQTIFSWSCTGVETRFLKDFARLITVRLLSDIFIKVMIRYSFQFLLVDMTHIWLTQLQALLSAPYFQQSIQYTCITCSLVTIWFTQTSLLKRWFQTTLLLEIAFQVLSLATCQYILFSPVFQDYPHLLFKSRN